MSGPLFPQGSPEALQLQAAIAQRLGEAGLDNDTLAEFIAVMILNRKGRAQVAEELLSIVGDELPSSFVDWIFDTLLSDGQVVQPVAEVASDEMVADSEEPFAEAGLDPDTAEFAPEEQGEEVLAEVQLSSKTPYRLLDKALSEATRDTTARSTRSAPYSVSDRPGTERKKAASEKSTTTFTVSLAGENPIERTEEKPIRCRFWPNCTKGSLECPFHHPSEVCPNPNCVEGDRCLYIHASPKVVPCKFGLSCTNPRCTYSHPTPALRQRGGGGGGPMGRKMGRSNVPCRFNPCLNSACPFVHLGLQQSGSFGNKTLVLMGESGGQMTSVSEIPCKFEPFCTRPGCPYLHGPKEEPVRRSERAFAVPEAEENLAELTDMVE